MMVFVLVVSSCSVVQSQSWMRRQQKKTVEPEPQVNSSWKYDLTPSAFQAGSSEAAEGASRAVRPSVRALNHSNREPAAKSPGLSDSRMSMPTVGTSQTAPRPSGNSVSAPQPRRRSADESSGSGSRSSTQGDRIDRNPVRTTNLTQTATDDLSPVGNLPPLPTRSGLPDGIPGESQSPPVSGLPSVIENAPPLNPGPSMEAIDPGNGISPATLFWWEADLGGPVLRGRPQMPMSLQESLHRALNEAPELKVLHADWYIQMQEQIRLDAAFDWTTFVDSVWNRDSTPVGSQLDGAAQRLRSRSESAAAGIRRLDRTGGEFEFSQQIAGKESNSQFISPNNQGSSRLSLKYERPLLRGAGRDYNTGTVQIAQLDKDIAFDRMQAGIQDHLLQTARAYWALVLARGDFLQKVTSWSRAKAVADEMSTRVEVDVTPGALDRAKSEVASRLVQSIQAEHDVTAAQEVLLELIYASRFTEFTHYEVLTTTAPPHHPNGIDVESQAELGMQTRSEIQQAIREVRAASIEYNLAKSEVLPKLDLVLTGYTAGLRPNYNIGQSFIDQFSEGEPGAGVGLDFEIPYGNRAAKAAAEQRRIAVTRLQREFEIVVGEVKQDVRQQAIRRNKFASTLPQQWESLVLARRMMDYSQTRRDFLADGVRVAELYLNDLLQIQNRLQNAEFQYLQTQVSFAVADNALMRSVSSIQTLAEPASGTGTYSESAQRTPGVVQQNEQMEQPVLTPQGAPIHGQPLDMVPSLDRAPPQDMAPQQPMVPPTGEYPWGPVGNGVSFPRNLLPPSAVRSRSN